MARNNIEAENFNNPFKGPKPYVEGDNIYGRNDEVDILFDYITDHTLTLLYAKSGMGKSSLLQAGLMPELRNSRNFLPIYVRLNALDLISVTQVKQLLKKNIKTFGKKIPGFNFNDDKTTPSSSLFEYLHLINITITETYTANIDETSGGHTADAPINPARVINDVKTIIPVLIFDQFEEVFTILSDKKLPLFEDIKYLLEDEIHPSLLKRMNSDLKDDMDTVINIKNKISSKEKTFRILLSFREEYLTELESLRDSIPSIIHTPARFRLEGFTQETATELILEITEKREVKINESLAQKISQLIVENNAKTSFASNSQKIVSPFILSLICYKLYPQIVDKGEKKVLSELKKAGRSKIVNLVNDYYEDVFENINEITRIFIEDELVTTEGNRTLYPYNSIINYSKGTEEENQILKKDIDILIGWGEDKTQLYSNRFLNKNEYLNIPHIEILHDQLLSPVINSRFERITRNEEKRKREEEEKKIEQLAKERRAEEKRRREEEQKKEQIRLAEEQERETVREEEIARRRRRLLIIAISSSAVIIIFLVAIFYTLLYNRAIDLIKGDFNSKILAINTVNNTLGPYNALDTGSKYYSRIHKVTEIIKSKIFTSKRADSLNRVLDSNIIKYYNCTPFYGSLSNPIPEIQLSPDGKNACKITQQQDSLFFYNLKTFGPRKEVPISAPTPIPISVFVSKQNKEQADNDLMNISYYPIGFNANGYGYQSATIDQENTYTALLKGRLLYLYKNSDCSLVKCWKFNNNISFKFSLDEKCIIFWYSPAYPLSDADNKTVYQFLGTEKDTISDMVTVNKNAFLLNVVKTDNDFLYYVLNNVNKHFELNQYKCSTKTRLFTSNELIYPNFNTPDIFNSNSSSSNKFRRHLYGFDPQLKKWHIFDLIRQTKPDMNVDISDSIHNPVKIFMDVALKNHPH